jgi:tetratricopeptide (TPR) repeat protein
MKMKDNLCKELTTFADSRRNNHKIDEQTLINGNYLISEEADMFGFSFMKSFCEFRVSRMKNINNLELMKTDDNWNNPGSISLMVRSFGIPDTKNESNVLSDFGNYISIKKEQEPLFAERHVKTGNNYLQSKQYKEALRFFADALKYDPICVGAMLGRASALLHMGQLLEANKQMNCIANDSVVDANVSALRKRISDQLYAAGLGAQVTVVSSSSAGVSGITFVDKLRLSLQSDQTNDLLILRDVDELDSSSSESSREDNNKSKKKKKVKSDLRKSKKSSRRSELDSDSDRSRRRRKRSKSDKKSKKKRKRDDE